MPPKQIDIFGNETDCAQIARSRYKGNRRKRMQEMHGTIEGKTCKTCKHCVKYIYDRNKSWYKCELWAVTSCAATDIRLKDTACGKYEEDEQ